MCAPANCASPASQSCRSIESEISSISFTSPNHPSSFALSSSLKSPGGACRRFYSVLISSALGLHLFCSSLSRVFWMSLVSHHWPQLVRKIRSGSSGMSVQKKARSKLWAPISRNERCWSVGLQDGSSLAMRLWGGGGDRQSARGSEEAKSPGLTLLGRLGIGCFHGRSLGLVVVSEDACVRNEPGRDGHHSAGTRQLPAPPVRIE